MGAAALLLAWFLAVTLDAQTTRKRATRPRKSPRADSTHVRDSVAAARSDSLRRAVERAALDSLRRAEELLARHREDSLAAHRLRVVRNDAFGVGERLVFDVNYGYVTAGEAVMHVADHDFVDERKCYRVEFKVSSLPSFSLFYKVEDRYLTFIDEETLAPWRFEQHIREGSYRRDFVARFDQRKKTAVTSEGAYETPEYVHDILSAFYFARTIDFTSFQKGSETRLHNFYKDKSHVLVVRFLGRQELEVSAGTFNTVVIEPLVQEGGLFKSEGRIVIWLTDDERKIPVRVNTKVIIGSIDTELREYSGLIGPLKARIK
jgi:hypothetical protein